MTTTKSRLHATLASLGQTADQIADRLRSLGVKGRRNRAACCPVAVYLTRKGIADPAVSEDFITFATGPDGRRTEAVTPEPVAEFIYWFDKGVYLDLAERAEPEADS